MKFICCLRINQIGCFENDPALNNLEQCVEKVGFTFNQIVAEDRKKFDRIGSYKENKKMNAAKGRQISKWNYVKHLDRKITMQKDNDCGFKLRSQRFLLPNIPV